MFDYTNLIRHYLDDRDICVHLPELATRVGKCSIEVYLVYTAEHGWFSYYEEYYYAGDSYRHEYDRTSEIFMQSCRLFFALGISTSTRRAIMFLHCDDIFRFLSMVDRVVNGRAHEVIQLYRDELIENDKKYWDLLIEDEKSPFAYIPDPSRQEEMDDLLEREMAIYEKNMEAVATYNNACALMRGLFPSRKLLCFPTVIPCSTYVIYYTPSAKRTPWTVSVCASSMEVVDDRIRPPRETADSSDCSLRVRVPTTEIVALFNSMRNIVCRWMDGDLHLPNGAEIPDYVPELDDFDDEPYELDSYT